MVAVLPSFHTLALPAPTSQRLPHSLILEVSKDSNQIFYNIENMSGLGITKKSFTGNKIITSGAM